MFRKWHCIFNINIFGYYFQAWKCISTTQYLLNKKLLFIFANVKLDIKRLPTIHETRGLFQSCQFRYLNISHLEKNLF